MFIYIYACLKMVSYRQFVAVLMGKTMLDQWMKQGSPVWDKQKKKRNRDYTWWLYGGFLKMGVHKMDGLRWKILLKWMIWRYPYFRTPPYDYSYLIRTRNPIPCSAGDSLKPGFRKSMTHISAMKPWPLSHHPWYHDELIGWVEYPVMMGCHHVIPKSWGLLPTPQILGQLDIKQWINRDTSSIFATLCLSHFGRSASFSPGHTTVYVA